MALSSTNSSETAEDAVRDGRHPTGISVLDEEVLRGIPTGSTVAIVADPDGAGELLLHAMATTGRNTQYITTNRSEKTIQEDIERMARENNRAGLVDDDTLTIRDTHNSSSSFDDMIRRALGTVEDGNIVIDTFSRNYDDDSLLALARRIHTGTHSNGGLTYLYFVASTTEDLTRQEREILQMVDGVFNIKSSVTGGDNIKNRLFINKLRGVDFPDTAQNLVFGRNIGIDTTADIG